MKITGIWRGHKIDNKFKKAASKGLWKGMEGVVLTEANKIVPWDEGTLEGSGFASEGDLESAVSYGGGSTPYAIRLHEHPEYNFQHGGEGKWLEKTIKRKEVQDKVLQAVARELRKEFG